MAAGMLPSAAALGAHGEAGPYSTPTEAGLDADAAVWPPSPLQPSAAPPPASGFGAGAAAGWPLQQSAEPQPASGCGAAAAAGWPLQQSVEPQPASGFAAAATSDWPLQQSVEPQPCAGSGSATEHALLAVDSGSSTEQALFEPKLVWLM